MSMLLSLFFIKCKRYSHIDYYYKVYDGRCVSWSFVDDAEIRDLERWSDKFRGYYNINDKKRTNAMKNLIIE